MRQKEHHRRRAADIRCAHGKDRSTLRHATAPLSGTDELADDPLFDCPPSRQTRNTLCDLNITSTTPASSVQGKIPDPSAQ